MQNEGKHMSYSFSVKESTKDAAKDAVAAKMQETVLPTQPMHWRDYAAILANANATVDLLADDDTKDIAVSCNGYLSWSGSGEVSDASPIGTASISCTASNAHRE
jgi:hypothetical protein